MSLSYECIVKDKRITFEVDDSDNPWVTLKFFQRSETLCFKASDDALNREIKNKSVEQDDIQYVVDMVHQAYQDAYNSRF